MQARRKHPVISVRSAKIAALLERHVRPGRTKVSIIEEALERLPIAPDHPREIERRARIDELLARLQARTDIPSMAEFDAREYDERGNPR